MSTAGARPPLPEVELLRRIAARDECALAELYDRFSSTVFGMGVRILGDHAEAEELLQEVFLQVWNRGESYDPAYGTPGSWLVRITRNRAIDRYRARRVRAHLSDQPLESVSERATDATTLPPDVIAANADRKRHVARALTRLRPEQRSLIECAFFLGLTHTELAVRFGLPLGTVKTRIRTGLRALRDGLPQGAL